MPAKPTSGERLMLLDSASLYFRAFFGVPDERSDPDAPQNNAIRGLLDMIASLVERRTGRPTSWPAGTTTGARRSGSRPSRPTRRTGWPSRGRRRVEESRRPGPARGAGPDHRRRARRARHRPRRRRRLRGRRRDRHAGDRVAAACAGRRRHRRPRPVPAGRRREPGAGPLHRSRRRARTPTSSTRRSCARSTASPTGDAYADMAVLRGDTSDGLPGVAGIGEKTAAELINGTATSPRSRGRHRRRRPADQGRPAGPARGRAAYLDVAPRSSGRQDAPVPDVDPALPTAVADPMPLSSCRPLRPGQFAQRVLAVLAG